MELLLIWVWMKISLLFCTIHVLPLKERLIHKEEKYILFAGTLNKRKNYEKLIYAFSKFTKKNNSWKLIFAGNGEIERAKKITKNLKIENKVIFKGWVIGKRKT